MRGHASNFSKKVSFSYVDIIPVQQFCILIVLLRVATYNSYFFTRHSHIWSSTKKLEMN